MLGTEGGTTTVAARVSILLLSATGSPSGLSECSVAREFLRRRSGLSDMMLLMRGETRSRPGGLLEIDLHGHRNGNGL
jgi:hypothetical protein